MSKLIDKLNNLNKSTLPAMGFRRPDCDEKQMSMLVLADMSGKGEAEVQEISICGVAGGIIDSSGLSAASLSRCLKNAGDMAVGLVFMGGKTGNGSKLISGDLDFIAFNINLPIAAFEGKTIEQIGKVLNVETAIESGLLRSVHSVYPGIDAIMIDLRVSPLTMENMINCRRVADFGGQHIIALINKSLSSAELLALREAGVKALVLPQDAGVDDLKSMIDAVSSLPRQEKKDKKTVALLPRMGLSPAPKEDDNSDDDDGDDSDDE